MSTTAAAIFHDQDLQAQANAAGANYWHTYTREICDQIGLRVATVTRPELTASGLDAFRVLILPDLPGKYFRPGEKAVLEAWVEAGGMLVGFATEGLGHLFGVTIEETLPQVDDQYSLSAALVFTDAEFARPLLPPGEEDSPIPVAAPMLLLRSDASCRMLAQVVELFGRDLRRPGVTLRQVGQGQALYFAFNVAQSVWSMHHGRPILDDYDGDGKLRASDAMVLRPFPTSLPYADLLTMLLRNVIGRTGVPFIYALPPIPGTSEVPDALFHWGGDDEAAGGQQLPASRFMRGLGLPYHLNIMPDTAGNFAMSREEFAEFRANGHEPSLHFNFVDGCEHPYSFTRQDIQRQVDWYVAAFGETPVCTVFHYTLWNLWSEPAEWMAGCGLLSDNSHIHQPSPPTNPINIIGFGFGTGYPYHFYNDWRKGNERIRFLGLPINAYECGYTRETEVLDLKPLHRAIDLAAYWHLTMNMFYHSVCIYQFPQCRAAIRAALDYMAESGLKAVHMGNDELTQWWLARSEIEIAGAESTTGATELTVDVEWQAGCVLQLCCGQGPPDVSVDGQAAQFQVREEHGGRWLYVAVPAGKHQVVFG